MADLNIELFKDLLIKDGDSALLNAKYMSMSAEGVIDAYNLAGLPEPIVIVENKWFTENPIFKTKRGWGNGYVKIVPGHKFYDKRYEDIDVKVNGGITFSEHIKDDSIFGSKGYWIGFDTSHYGDTLEKWRKEEVYNETLRLFKQIYHLS